MRKLVAWLLPLALLASCHPPARPDLTAPLGNGQSRVVLADFNGDGDLDVATAVAGFHCYKACAGDGEDFYDPGYVELQLSQQRGQPLRLTELPAGTSPRALAAADVDGDHDLDLLVTDRASHQVHLLRNDGHGHFDPADSTPTESMPENIAIADLDADGDLDFAVACSNTGLVTLGFNDGHGCFRTRHLNVSGDAYLVALADLDGDHYPDLLALVSCRQGDSLRVCFNNGAGHFGSTRRAVDSTEYHFFPDRTSGLRPSQHTDVGQEPIRLTTGDVDGDGDLDVVTITNRPGQQAINQSLNDGHGHLASAPQVVLSFAPGHHPESVALADLDGDYDLDVAARCYQDSIIYVQLNDGHGAYTGPHPPARAAAYRGPGRQPLPPVHPPAPVALLTADWIPNELTATEYYLVRLLPH